MSPQGRVKWEDKWSGRRSGAAGNLEQQEIWSGRKSGVAGVWPTEACQMERSGAAGNLEQRGCEPAEACELEDVQRKEMQTAGNRA